MILSLIDWYYSHKFQIGSNLIDNIDLHWLFLFGLLMSKGILYAFIAAIIEKISCGIVIISVLNVF